MAAVDADAPNVNLDTMAMSITHGELMGLRIGVQRDGVRDVSMASDARLPQTACSFAPKPAAFAIDLGVASGIGNTLRWHHAGLDAEAASGGALPPASTLS